MRRRISPTGVQRSLPELYCRELSSNWFAPTLSRSLSSTQKGATTGFSREEVVCSLSGGFTVTTFRRHARLQETPWLLVTRSAASVASSETTVHGAMLSPVYRLFVLVSLVALLTLQGLVCSIVDGVWIDGQSSTEADCKRFLACQDTPLPTGDFLEGSLG